MQEVEALQSRAQQHASAIFSCLELNHKANISIARMLASSAGSLHVFVWIFEQKLAAVGGISSVSSEDKSHHKEAAVLLQTGFRVKPERCAASPADQTEAGQN